MRVLKLSKSDFEENRKYKKGSLEFNGHVEIESGLDNIYFDSIKVGGHIFAGKGTSIVVFHTMIVGQDIIVEGDLRVGESLQAGEDITVDGNLWVGLRVFAGLVAWRLPRPDEVQIRCRTLLNGTVAYGKLIEKSPRR